jgi:hypothetical protein
MAEPIRLLSYSQVRQRQQRHPLNAEIPTENIVSFPLPTRRWGAPAFAFFASPALTLPNEVRQGPPSRWFGLDAASGRLLFYALCEVVPLPSPTPFESIELAPRPGTFADLEANMARLESVLDAASSAFFSNHSAPGATRQDVEGAFAALVDAPILEQYRALAPDFWAWLES